MHFVPRCVRCWELFCLCLVHINRQQYCCYPILIFAMDLWFIRRENYDFKFFIRFIIYGVHSHYEWGLCAYFLFHFFNLICSMKDVRSSESTNYMLRGLKVITRHEIDKLILHQMCIVHGLHEFTHVLCCKRIQVDWCFVDYFLFVYQF